MGYKLCPGGYKVSIDSDVVEALKRAHSIGN
jgi:hypothetical protein